MQARTAKHSKLDRQIARLAAETIAKGSKSFAAAAKLFRPATRRDVFMLYAWCRHCDDVTDGQDHGRGQAQQATIETIQTLRSNSLAAVRGQPCEALPFIALASVARRHQIPEWLIEDHLAGFEFDANDGRPQTVDDLMRYCYQVAGSVGVMMAMIMGVRDERTLYRANDLGLAFQLTNIARDIREDSERQRCYLPLAWLTEHQLTESDLALAEHQQTAYQFADRLVAMAEPYYASARIGIEQLPLRSAWAIAAARLIYRDIGLKIQNKGVAAIRERIFTTRKEKIRRIRSGMVEAIQSRTASLSTERKALWTPEFGPLTSLPSNMTEPAADTIAKTS